MLISKNMQLQISYIKLYYITLCYYIILYYIILYCIVIYYIWNHILYIINWIIFYHIISNHIISYYIWYYIHIYIYYSSFGRHCSQIFRTHLLRLPKWCSWPPGPPARHRCRTSWSACCRGWSHTSQTTERRCRTWCLVQVIRDFPRP